VCVRASEGSALGWLKNPKIRSAMACYSLVRLLLLFFTLSGLLLFRFLHCFVVSDRLVPEKVRGRKNG
jgi:hypothetical protein